VTILSPEDGLTLAFVPAVNDRGTVAFLAEDIRTGVQALYKHNGETLIKVVDSTNVSFYPRPENFATFLGPSISESHDESLVFSAMASATSEQVFTATETSLFAELPQAVSVHNSTTTELQFPSINKYGQIAYAQYGRGVFSRDCCLSGGPSVALPTPNLPNEIFFYEDVSVNNQGTIAFITRGPFLSQGNHLFVHRNGALTRLAGSPDIIPVYASLNGQDSVAFGGDVYNLVTGQRISRHVMHVRSLQTPVAFASTGQPNALYASLEGGVALNNRETVAFSAIPTSSPAGGIFNGPTPDSDTVIAPMSLIDGMSLLHAYIGNESLNDAGQLAFFGAFAEGNGAYRLEPFDKYKQAKGPWSCLPITHVTSTQNCSGTDVFKHNGCIITALATIVGLFGAEIRPDLLRNSLITDRLISGNLVYVPSFHYSDPQTGVCVRFKEQWGAGVGSFARIVKALRNNERLLLWVPSRRRTTPQTSRELHGVVAYGIDPRVRRGEEVQPEHILISDPGWSDYSGEEFRDWKGRLYALAESNGVVEPNYDLTLEAYFRRTTQTNPIPPNTIGLFFEPLQWFDGGVFYKKTAANQQDPNSPPFTVGRTDLVESFVGGSRFHFGYQECKAAPTVVVHSPIEVRLTDMSTGVTYASSPDVAQAGDIMLEKHSAEAAAYFVPEEEEPNLSTIADDPEFPPYVLELPHTVLGVPLGIDILAVGTGSFELRLVTGVSRLRSDSVMSGSVTQGQRLAGTIASVLSGDSNADGDVDLSDYADFLSFFGGPDQEVTGEVLAGNWFDTDSDGDIDMFDFASAANWQTGSLGSGRCCLPEGTCRESTIQLCNILNGKYGGDDTFCAGFVCPAPAVGACCRRGLPCSPSTRDACADEGDMWLGSGTSCDQAQCPQVNPIGACCNPEVAIDQCVGVIRKSVCLSSNGAHVGAGTDCTQAQCNGRCSQLNPSCDYCWLGTRFENNCPIIWFGAGDGCDCGCQSHDVDCD